MDIFDPIVMAISALSLIAVAAIGAAYYYARQAARLRTVSAEAHQLAGNLFFADNSVSEEYDAGAQLLLDVLAYPDGSEADALVKAEVGTPYEVILQRAGSEHPRVSGCPHCVKDIDLPITQPGPHVPGPTT